MIDSTEREIGEPNYSARLLEITMVVAALAGTMLGLLWQQPRLPLRVAAGAGILIGSLLLVNVPFAVNWVRAQWARARSYPRLLRLRTETENRLAKLQARYALATGAIPLPVVGFFPEEGHIVIVLDTDDASELHSGENIYIVDTIQRKHVGTAVVSTVSGKRVDTSLGEADALFKGFLLKQISANPGVACGPQESLIGLREKDIEAHYSAVREAEEG